MQPFEDNITSPTQLPYFKDDFWPCMIEESVRDIDQEGKDRK